VIEWGKFCLAYWYIKRGNALLNQTKKRGKKTPCMRMRKEGRNEHFFTIRGPPEGPLD